MKYSPSVEAQHIGKASLPVPGRIVWVDVLRFLAIFMVICIHCSDPFNVSPEARANPEYHFWGTLYGSFLRPCVPLFVMMTGLLLLPVRMSAKIFYKKRLVRIAVPFLLWSVLYNLYPWITGLLGLPSKVLADTFAYASPDASQTLSDALHSILLIPFQFDVYTVPMWYLYMLIGLYLYMPIFSAWIERATASQKRFFLYLWVITLFLPYVYEFFTADVFGQCAWNGFGTFYYFAGFNGYLLLGHYLYKETTAWSLQRTLVVAIPLFIAGYAAAYLGFQYITARPSCTESEMELFFLYCSPQVMVMTLAVFLLVRQVKIRSSVMLRALESIAHCGLGIYLVHYFVVGLGYAIADGMHIPVSIRIPVTAAIVFCIAWAFVALLRRSFPKAGKWIFG